MINQHKYVAMLLSLGAVMLLCISSQGKTKPTGGSAVLEHYTECPIDVNASGSCSLKESKDDRVVWVNTSAKDIYVCVDPNNDPFEAYAWLVPHQQTRKSGKIKESITPGNTYTFSAGIAACTVPPTPSPGGSRTNPQIIIQ